MPGETVLLLQTLEESPVTPAQIRKWTDRDPILSRVRLQVQDGGVIDKEGDFQPYSRRKDELSTQDGCLLWGS